MKLPHPQKQRGVTLVMSLVILVTLTMLGLSSIQRTTSELTMAGNQRESGLMFQAAEVGLESAENYISASTSNADYNTASLGLYSVDASNTSYDGPDYLIDSSWASGSQVSTTSLDVNEQPRYMIEYLGDRYQDISDKKNTGGGYGDPPSGRIVSIYRSTSRGVGLTGNSQRYIQSYYGKDAP
jgi:type IV pilus assembly protein PilX